MPDERHPDRTENLERWAVMSDALSRQVAEAFEAVSEDDIKALLALDGFEADRIQSRRRYEEFVDFPVARRHLSAG
jgi:hypothetical protein